MRLDPSRRTGTRKRLWFAAFFANPAKTRRALFRFTHILLARTRTGRRSTPAGQSRAAGADHGGLALPPPIPPASDGSAALVARRCLPLPVAREGALSAV